MKTGIVQRLTLPKDMNLEQKIQKQRDDQEINKI